jgi:hypothetical protein
MKVTIANKTLKITDSTGHITSMNTTYGTYFYDPVFAYVVVRDVSDTEIRLQADLITEYNGVAGVPTFAQITADLEINTRA